MQRTRQLLASVAIILLLAGCASSVNYQKGLDSKTDLSQMAFLNVIQSEKGLSLRIAKIDDIAYGNGFFGYPKGSYYLMPGQHQIEFNVYKIESSFSKPTREYSGYVTISYSFETGKKYSIVATTDHVGDRNIKIEASVVESD